MQFVQSGKEESLEWTSSLKKEKRIGESYESCEREERE